MKMLIALSSIAIILTSILSAAAQMPANPPYVLEQSVIAAGGGQNLTGGNFSLDGTIGQSLAGTGSTANMYVVAGGFWTTQMLAPTAAAVSVSGRVLTPDGRGLRNARVTLTDQQGHSQTAMSSTFGYYRFDGAATGAIYVVGVHSKRYSFAPQVLSVFEEIADLNFLPMLPASITNPSEILKSK